MLKNKKNATRIQYAKRVFTSMTETQCRNMIYYSLNSQHLAKQNSTTKRILFRLQPYC